MPQYPVLAHSLDSAYDWDPDLVLEGDFPRAMDSASDWEPDLALALALTLALEIDPASDWDLNPVPCPASRSMIGSGKTPAED